ncbi:MAG: Smr/MutS family protein [Treponema sp.]|nr:Smr/MutS family protein [Treponema sp.]
MDFGDILSQWGEQQSQRAQKEAQKKRSQQVSHKRANARTKEEREGNVALTAEEEMERDAKKTVNPMELWLRRYGVTDKDKEAEEFFERTKMESREYLRTMPAEARIDLHGLTRDEAWSRLESFVTDCIARGLKKILIVHGKGNHSHGSDPVLGQVVRTFIERHEHLGSSGHPSHAQGGTGATWVIIK